MIPVHEAMKKAREAKGINRYELAKLAKVDASNIGRYERGDRAPGLFNLIALADALGISIDEYIGHEIKTK